MKRAFLAAVALLLSAQPKAAVAEPDYDPTPPPATPRTGAGSAGGSFLAGYAYDNGRHGPVLDVAAEASVPLVWAAVASIGLSARGWMNGAGSQSDEPHLDDIEPYISLSRSFAGMRWAAGYTREFEFSSANGIQRGEQEWYGAVARDYALVDGVTVSPAIYFGRVVAIHDDPDSAYVGPGLDVHVRLGSQWRLTAFSGAYLSRDDSRAGALLAGDTQWDVEAEAIVSRQISPGLAIAAEVGHERSLGLPAGERASGEWYASFGIRRSF